MPKQKEPCTVCGEPSVARKLCNKHYLQIRKTGAIDSSTYGTHTTHPLYERWRSMREYRVSTWDKFEAFINDVGEPPNQDLSYRLKRLDNEQPFGPNNFEWVAPLDLGPYQNNQNKYLKEWREQKGDYIKDGWLSKNYGISLKEFKDLLVRQKGVWAICHMPETTVRAGKLMDLAVDHNHQTNQVRGLLCVKCNRALGLLEENKETLLSAIEYLDKWNSALTNQPQVEYNINEV